MKFAYFVFPHLGGTYSVFRNLRKGLSPADIELRWLAASAGAHAETASPFFQSEARTGSLVGDPGDDERSQARALYDALMADGYDGVFVNVLADRVQTNIARYLPPRLLKVLLVHNITPGTYASAAAIRDHVHATVAIAPRIAADLVERYGFQQDRVITIPHGIDLDAFSSDKRKYNHEGARVLFLGRIEDQAKGVFWLPAILARLHPKIRMTVAGDGPSLAALKAMMRRFSDRVTFAGAITPEEAPRLFSNHDIFLMPSRFEGFGLVLAEAMAAGCVPVASHIRGVTDMMVESGRDGFLFPVGDVNSAAAAVNALACDHAMRFAMAGTASLRIRQNFSIPKCACSYLTLIDELAKSPPSTAEPFSLAAWNYPPGLRNGLRSYAPVWMKNTWRRWRERRQSGMPSGIRPSVQREAVLTTTGRGAR